MTDRHPTSVLISGGGVAGPALAFWLRRYGFEPTIVERAPRPRSGGQRIELSEAGQHVLRRMGLLDRVRAAGGPQPQATMYVGATDRPVRVPAVGVGAADQSPRSDRLAVSRTRLGEILYEEVRDRIPYLFADSITAIRQRPAGVEVDLDSGETRHVDLVIGADGLYSQVRRLVFGEHDRFLHYLGADQAYFTMDNHLGWRNVSRFHAWPYRGAAITTFPGNTELEGLFLIRRAESAVSPDLSREEQWAQVDRVFACDEWLVPSLLRAMRSSEDFRLMPCVQVRMESWRDGRVALAGDAAHCPDPMSGQGATLALAGAYVLAGELKAARGDHDVAFAAYERRMREFVVGSQELGELDIAMAAPRAGRAGVWLREQSLRMLLPAVDLGLRLNLQPRWLTATAPIALPDY
ncbi:MULTISPECIES: FAD-dependent monooxygenase [Actinoalloteichus]|uniref:2-polyprenyl-6-methoxyphenol hydroxylase-like oxidoreductase n=1 Tax=Actinoalloteichus fjordicus TaxID=1612552 RepID=A0AAC9LGN4_9PSEU|nr:MULTISPECIES: FAD-dependent monooxygenase [Actinoalloteichus]APU16412.1 2-polyprenyl-6-methoxyphenol hydroxylase-like oxidoreductase [Actinoalloteichus fjordicus]APU22470.1 2-polyprenyl-6-methoxyphenol hydroxylase-like oxidoreductase [Actinoalloteichus sp. GBA129-24]